jgi:excisionase family DNA binding protein
LFLKENAMQNTPERKDVYKDEGDQSEWLTADEAASYLKVKTRALLRLVRRGDLRGYALCGSRRHVWRFRKEDLDSALLAQPMVICKPLPVRSVKGATN